MIMVLTSYQSCSDRKRKDGGVYTTRADYRSWAHWGLGVRLIDKSLGFPQLLHSRWQQMFRGWLLTQCAWGPEVSLPARGRQDVAALRSGRSREIYWSRGSTFWPETSGKRAEPTKCSSGICSTPWERLVRLPLETFFFFNRQPMFGLCLQSVATESKEQYVRPGVFSGMWEGSWLSKPNQNRLEVISERRGDAAADVGVPWGAHKPRHQCWRTNREDK